MATVWFEGIDELNKIAVDLGDAGQESITLARVAVRKSSFDIVREAKSFVPVDTGFLKSSIGFETWEGDGEAGADIGPTADYGHYVEFGTSRMAPHAYMGPALDRNAPGFEQAMAQILDGIL